jgi:DUF1365 family protein
MTTPRSALYFGQVTHRRLRPRRHFLRYSVFYLLLDIDQVGALAASLRLFSYNSFNLFGFYDRDHGDHSNVSLRDQIEGHLLAASIDIDGGPIRLLAMPRVLGYAFNPISIYYCYHRDGMLAATLYEVNNTFGQGHCYLVPAFPGANDAAVTQESPKSLYVSPFLDTDMRYSFHMVPPAKQVALMVTGHDDAGPLIVAALSAGRHDLTDASLARAFLACPLVIVGIHWEGFLLWLKGIGLKPRPPAPDRPVTIGRQLPPVASKNRNREAHVPQQR